MTTTDPPAQRAGSLTIRPSPARPSPAILIREVGATPPIGAVEIDVLGVDGIYLDATLERVRGHLERFAVVVGRDIVLTPVGHPDAPSGYLVAGVTKADVERALDPRPGGSVFPSHVTRLDFEGRW